MPWENWENRNREAPIGAEPFDHQGGLSHHHFAILHGSPGLPKLLIFVAETMSCSLKSIDFLSLPKFSGLVTCNLTMIFRREASGQLEKSLCFGIGAGLWTNSHCFQGLADVGTGSNHNWPPKTAEAVALAPKGGCSCRAQNRPF